MNCPHCGKLIEPKRKRAPIVQDSTPVDVSKLSDKALYAHYKATAPNLDAAFFLNHAIGLTVDERLELTMLATNPVTNRADHYRRLTAIQDAWRRRPRPAIDAAFELWRSKLTERDQQRVAVRAFRVHRAEVISNVRMIADPNRAPYSSYRRLDPDQAYKEVRGLVARARELYPRVFEAGAISRELEAA